MVCASQALKEKQVEYLMQGNSESSFRSEAIY